MGKAEKSAMLRLQSDLRKLVEEPVPYIEAIPEENNILNWHYVFTGPPDSPYEGGIYHGMLRFPTHYPFSPPSIFIFTPNGRFELNKRICLSISDYHPDTWNPSWCVSTILTGLLSFMLDNVETEGSINTSVKIKKILAKRSLAFNLKSKMFNTLFPKYITKFEEKNENKRLEPIKSVSMEKISDNVSNEMTWYIKPLQYLDRYCTIGVVFLFFTVIATYIISNADS
ncbi:hypothetical protein A3Q56_04966 [Intoshia linei]|uniref:Ubiquitin-conjugating enzyme E2 J2 n=1 Tax=Intoshia linei TaxID=1819745 RepID=A0A177B0L8_9BILA|nr:hypothetical protein A3Q56_04966 [Intoshia linei]